jgi:hypothetical protein
MDTDPLLRPMTGLIIMKSKSDEGQDTMREDNTKRDYNSRRGRDSMKSMMTTMKRKNMMTEEAIMKITMMINMTIDQEGEGREAELNEGEVSEVVVKEVDVSEACLLNSRYPLLIMSRKYPNLKNKVSKSRKLV